jgi:hypothetical protein
MTLLSATGQVVAGVYYFYWGVVSDGSRVPPQSAQDMLLDLACHR